MSHQQNDIIFDAMKDSQAEKSLANETKIEIAKECGLTFDGMIKLDDGEYPQFIGDDKAWERFETALEIIK